MPEGMGLSPRYSGELGELAIKTGIFPLYEIIRGEVHYTYDARKQKRLPVKEYLEKQGRFSTLLRRITSTSSRRLMRCGKSGRSLALRPSRAG